MLTHAFRSPTSQGGSNATADQPGNATDDDPQKSPKIQVQCADGTYELPDKDAQLWKEKCAVIRNMVAMCSTTDPCVVHLPPTAHFKNCTAEALQLFTIYMRQGENLPWTLKALSLETADALADFLDASTLYKVTQREMNKRRGRAAHEYVDAIHLTHCFYCDSTTEVDVRSFCKSCGAVSEPGLVPCARCEGPARMKRSIPTCARCREMILPAPYHENDDTRGGETLACASCGKPFTTDENQFGTWYYCKSHCQQPCAEHENSRWRSVSASFCEPCGATWAAVNIMKHYADVEGFGYVVISDDE